MLVRHSQVSQLLAKLEQALGPIKLEGKLTETTNQEWYEVPCSLPDQLEAVEECCDGEEGDEDDCRNFVWIVVVKIVLLPSNFAHLELRSNRIPCKQDTWLENACSE